MKFKLVNIVFLVIIAFFIVFLFKNYYAANFLIGVKNTTFFDEDRNRPVIADIFYPVDSNCNYEKAIKNEIWKEDDKFINCPISTKRNKYPLVLFSHGYGGDKIGNVWFAEYLVKKGFIVVTMDHHGNTHYNLDEEISNRTWEKTTDLSFIITSLIESKEFGSHIDTNKIGAAGFSQGGWACLLLAGAKLDFSALDSKLLDDKVRSHDFKDPRVKSLFVMAPGTLQGQIFTVKSLQEIDIPVYIVAGESDNLIIPKNNAYLFANSIPSSKLHTLPAPANHWVFMSQATKAGKKILIKGGKDFLVNDPPKLDREDIHTQVGAVAYEFFKKIN